MDTLRENLADVQHAIWSHWMRYLFSRCVWDSAGRAVIPVDLVLRWHRQMDTPYNDLSEKERESDLHQADKVLGVFQPVLDAVPGYAHYFSVETLSLRLDGDMLGTPLSFAEWLAEATEPDPEAQP